MNQLLSIGKARDGLTVRCNELKQRFDALAVEIRKGNSVSSRNARITLAVIVVEIAILVAAAVAAAASDSQNNKPTPAERQPAQK